MAWQLVRHAFAMILGNLGQALKVSLIPYGILVVAMVFILAVVGMPLSNDVPLDAVSFSPMSLILILALFAFAIFVFGWVAVSWHRFILKEEYTTLVPAVSGRPIWPYIRRSMWLGLIVFLVAIPVLFVTSMIAVPFVGGSLIVPVIAFLAGATIVAFFWMRWAIALPAAAIGEDMTLSQAWSITAPMSKTILGVALILMAINVIPAFLLSGFYAVAPIIGFVIDLILQWLTVMLGLSILTTLYGHLVEGRSL